MNSQRQHLEEIAVHLQSARFPEEVFGLSVGEAAQHVKIAFRRLVRECHPNVHQAADRPLAEQVTERVLHFKAAADRRLAAGIYGNTSLPTPASSLSSHGVAGDAGTANSFTPARFTVGRHVVTLAQPLPGDLLCDHYRAEFGADEGLLPVVKVVRSAGDNGLLEREFAVLERLWAPEPTTEYEEFAARQRHYVPRPALSFLVAETGGAKRRANLLLLPAQRAFTVAQLRAQPFPDGVPPAHGYWIFRRLLLTLWLAHRKGFVHGAVTPDKVLVYPEEHGLVLLDWTAAARVGREKVPLADAAYEAYLPPELLAHERAKPAMDIFMAAATTVFLLGGDVRAQRLPASVPQPIAAELLRCLAPAPRYRPQDAYQLHESFGRLLGRRVYVPMTVP